MTEPICEQQLVVGLGGDHRQGDVAQADFDELLHSNVLDTLADFDFSCADLAGTEPDPKILCTPGGTRKRTFSMSQAWDALSPKPDRASAVVNGVWDSTVAPGAGSHQTQESTSSGDHAAGGAGGCHTPPGTEVRYPRGMAGPMSTRQAEQQHSTSPASVPDGSAGASGRELQRSSALFGTSTTTGPQEGMAAVQQVSNTAAAAVGVVSVKQEGGARGGKRKAQGGAGGGKRPLNPDRMERKATREKRRREEVNEKFEQLLTVLEEAEATSGLEPPVPEDGQQVGACVNGRRVEVLSRTISILRKLLNERRERAAQQASTDAAAPPTCFEYDNASHSRQQQSQRASAHESNAAVITPPEPAATTITASECASSLHETASSSSAVLSPAAPVSAEATAPSTCPAIALTTLPVAGTPSTSSPPTSATAAPAAAADAAAPAGAPAAVQHVAIPVHQPAHAGMTVPPGFVMAAHHHPGMVMPAGVPAGQIAAAVGAAHMPTTMHGMHPHPSMQGHHTHAQPFFIAVPMYMPSGAGQSGVSPITNGTVCSEAAAPVAQATTPAPADSPSAPANTGSAARPPTEGTSSAPQKAGAASAGVLGKDAWSVPGGVGFPPMMLQMPQFVTQALSAEEGDEKVTHAMCA